MRVRVVTIFPILALSNTILLSEMCDVEAKTGILISLASAAVVTGIISGTFWLIDRIREEQML